jgi:hypothetical protein
MDEDAGGTWMYHGRRKNNPNLFNKQILTTSVYKKLAITYYAKYHISLKSP